MGKDMVILILREQLAAANATISGMAGELRALRLTLEDLRLTVANQERLLKV